MSASAHLSLMLDRFLRKSLPRGVPRLPALGDTLGLSPFSLQSFTPSPIFDKLPHPYLTVHP